MDLTIQTLAGHSASQQKIIEAFHTPKLREIWVANGSKYGKAININEIVATKNGYKKFGDLKVGDYVFSEHGKLVQVTFVTDTMYDHDCYEVTFSDSQVITADAEHLWFTQTYAERKNEARCHDRLRKYGGVRTTLEILDTLEHETSEGNRPNHSIPLVSSPLEFPHQDLPIDPYVLSIGILSEYGGTLAKIPDQYFIGSINQRLDLLRGFMDLQGKVCEKGDCSFKTSDHDLAKGIMKILMSLGILVNLRTKGDEHTLFFTLKDFICSYKSTNRYITSVKKVASVPVRCIKVYNPTSLFVIGEGCIPTHNTIAAVSAVIAKAPLVSDAVFRWIAPIHPQSMIAMRYAQRFLPNTKHIQFNRSDRAILFHPINTRWEFRTGKDPENLEGEATAGNVLDECAKMHEQVYASVKTTVTVTQGPIMCISTPRGKNWFFQKCQEARAEQDWAIANGRTPRRIFLNAPTSDNPHVSAEVIEDARKALPLRLFKQYFLAEFVEDGNTFANFRKCFYTDPLELPLSNEKWFDPAMDKVQHEGREVFDCTVVIAADWAKKVDHTVFTAWDYRKKRMVGFWRFQGVNYLHAVKKVYNFGRKFKDVELLIHDQTGIGEVIGDLLDKTHFPHQGIIFTNKNKTFMVNNLIIAFEQMEIEIPHWIEMVSELDVYEVETNQLGMMKFSAPKGMHDDIVSSMILGWSAVSDYSTSEMSVKIIEELKKNEKPDENWLHDYIDDDDDGDTPSWETAMMRPKRPE